MAPEPFLVVPVHSCRDLLHARHRARQVGQLLKFADLDVSCIAAGAFVIGQQARQVFRPAELCFALVQRQLRIYARGRNSQSAELGSGCIMAKPLPEHDAPLAAEDIAWLIRQVEVLAPTTLHAEISRQNQEVLALLVALRGGQAVGDPSVIPWAA